MSINIDYSARLGVAVADWLDSVNKLAETTQRSYRSEVSRFTRFCADEFSLIHMGEVRPKHWRAYVLGLRQGPQEPVQASSATQSMRISRLFLEWCAREGMLDWWPTHVKVPGASRRRKRLRLEIPCSVRQALCGQVVPADVEDARALMAINLAFWAALTPAQMMPLKASALNASSDTNLHLQVANRTLALPSHFEQLWDAYREAREEGDVQVQASSPLLCQVGLEAPVSSWTIWFSIKQWQTHQGVGQAMTARQLRQGFLDLSLQLEAKNLPQALSHARLRSIPVGAASKPRMSSVQTMHRRIQSALQ